MERVRISDVDTPMEAAKVFNRLIDRMNENDEYNEAVEDYNGALVKKKGAKDA